MIEWEELTPAERQAVKLLGEQDPLTFTRLWFQITQGERFIPNWHHRYFNLEAQKVLQGKTRNLIINVAPGSTKTEFFSIHLPAYCFAKYKRCRILNTSFSKELVSENSERTRSLIQSEEWQELYPHAIGKNRVDDWTINGENGKRQHQIFSRSSGGQITGVRGGYMTRGKFSGYVSMDDWQKPEDMFSEAKRNASNRRASNTLRSRRADDRTPVISIQQRLHVEDVTAFLLSGGMGLEFDQVKIPALINEEYIQSLPDEVRDRCWQDVKNTDQIQNYWSFFPQKESARDLFDLWESDPYTFTSQYMQAPEQLSGGVFDPDKFGYYLPEAEQEDGSDIQPRPAFEYRFITGDTAQKTAERNDYSVLAEWGFAGGKIYLIRLLRGKWQAPQLRAQALSFINDAWQRNDGYWNGNLRAVLVEDKASGTGLIQEIGSQSPVPITAIQRNTDKLTRALDVQSHQQAGKIQLPYGAPWVVEFVAEVASFTTDDTHPHDDQTDVMMDAIDYAVVQQVTATQAASFAGRSASRRRR